MRNTLALPEKDLQNMSRIVAKTWSDPDFKKAFLGDPRSVLLSFGVAVSNNIEVIVKDDETGGIAQENGQLLINIPSIPSMLGDSTLTFDDTEVLYSIKLCCTCVEIDPKLQLGT